MNKKKITVGIAGLGGLGSNVANALVRLGGVRLIIADFDVVDKSNLDRQLYFADQVGRVKVEAAIENLTRIDPDVEIVGHNVKLTPDNIPEIFAEAVIIAECFDKADQKQMLVETVLTKCTDKVIVAVSGLAGYGRSNDIVTKKISDKLIMVGDGVSELLPGVMLVAARVAIAAYHQANAITELILDRKTGL